jgi:predicted histone-like DNA-binding protein
MANVIKTKKYAYKVFGTDTVRYAKRAIRYSTISGDELVEAASRNSQVNPGVMRSAMNAVLNEFHNFMLNGHSVELPGLGYFRFSFSAKAAKSEEDLKEKGLQMKRKRVLFRPNTLIREELSAVTFEMDEEKTKAPEGGEGEGEDDELA